MTTYVVLCMQVLDTAVIKADDEQAAIALYEKPEGLEEADLVLWAVPEPEFAEMVGNGE